MRFLFFFFFIMFVDTSLYDDERWNMFICFLGVKLFFSLFFIGVGYGIGRGGLHFL